MKKLINEMLDYMAGIGRLCPGKPALYQDTHNRTTMYRYRQAPIAKVKIKSETRTGQMIVVK
jgi:hypothetical protein